MSLYDLYDLLCCARRRLHPDLAGRVLPVTLKRYSRIFEQFTEFASTVDIPANYSQQEAIEHAIELFRDTEQLSKTLHQRVVTATEFFLPQYKGNLKRCREAVKGHLLNEPTRHTVASTSRIIFLFACTLSSEGKSRVGVALILQGQTGLRADELVDIRGCDVSVPHCESEALIIALGVRKRTKAKRVQHVVLDPVRHLESYLLVKLLVCTTDPSGLLFPFTYWVFHSSIRAMDARFKLDLGLSGHSGRACFATEAIIVHKLSVPDAMREGRWLSESAFRMYVDIVGASAAQASFAARGLAPAADFCRMHVLRYLIPDRLRNEQHGVRASKEALELHRAKAHTKGSGSEPVADSTAAATSLKGPAERMEQGAGRHAQSQHGRHGNRGQHGIAAPRVGGSKGKGRSKDLLRRLRQGS